MDSSSLHAGLVVTVLVKFLYLFAASMLLGLAFGLGTSFLMKRARSNSVPQVCSSSNAQCCMPCERHKQAFEQWQGWQIPKSAGGLPRVRCLSGSAD